ncbi:hypothetical protein ACHWQZ_G004143 [Mnemiopsis leidyi]
MRIFLVLACFVAVAWARGDQVQDIIEGYLFDLTDGDGNGNGFNSICEPEFVELLEVLGVEDNMIYQLTAVRDVYFC